MNENPYESPASLGKAPAADRNTIGRIGFGLSVVGVLGVFVIGFFGPPVSTVGVYASFLSLPGLGVSAVGLSGKPKRLAGWGLGLGIFGSLFLPTIFLSLFI